MGRLAIHPGEHLAEQLEELGMSAPSGRASTAAPIATPTLRIILRRDVEPAASDSHGSRVMANLHVNGPFGNCRK